MTAATSTSQADTMPAATFSYAQAAKGATANVTAPSSTASSTTGPSTSTTNPIAQHSAQQMTASTAQMVDAAESKVDVQDAVLGEQARSADVKSESADKPASEPTNGSVNVILHSSAPPSVIGSGRGDDDAATVGSTQRSEGTGRSGSAPPRAADDDDAKKSRKLSKKGRFADNDAKDEAAEEPELEPEPAPAKVEQLLEAPIPAVNFWQQRSEQAAKKNANVVASKPATGADVVSPVTVESVSKPQDKPLDYKKKSRGQEDSDAIGSGQNGTHINGAKGQRKGGDGGREGESRRSGPRGSRADKDVVAIPSVADKSLWPTLDTSAREERRSSLEKTEGLEKDGQEPAPGPKRKKWEKVEITPTYKFETQFQSSRGRGRGGARGGRDGTSRGGHGANASSAADKNGSGPGSDSAQLRANGNETKDRREPLVSARHGSLPPMASKLPQGDGAPHRERKASAPASTTTDRNRDAGLPAGQDQAHTSRERGEGKPERGGRGGHRGRGGPSTQIQTSAQVPSWPGQNGVAYPYRPSPPAFSPTPSRNPMFPAFTAATQKPVRVGGPNRLPQASYALPPRIPLPNGTGGRPGHVQPVVVQSPYPYDYPISPASAPFPFAPAYDTLLISGLMSQIDYYFSEDNLPKDAWLRRQMDSQGFVMLQTVCQFRRMQQIANDLQAIRLACVECNSIDFVLGDDNQERVRRRNDWQRWVMPMEDRDINGRSDGPMRLYYLSRHAQLVPQFAQDTSGAAYPVMATSYAPPNGGAQEFQSFAGDSQPDHQTNGHANGNGYVPESQLSAAVPEFSPRTSTEGFGTLPNESLKKPFSPELGGGQFNSSDYGVASPSSYHGGANGVAVGLQSPTNGMHEADADAESLAARAGDAA